MSLSKLTKYCACHEKWISWLILVTHETLFTMRGVTTVIVQTHQILRLPRKMNLMIDPCHTWNAIYNARSNKCHCPNSPNTAPATKSNTHHWSLSHMKRYLQCAEQQVSLSKLTKYCACHAKWFSKISKKFVQNRWNVSSNARPIRAGSELDPSWIREWNRHPQPASQPRLLFRTTATFLYWKIQHFALRLSFQISPNTAPATKNDTSTSPNTAPATQNDSHHWSSWHVTRHLQCAAQQHSPSDLTKYCACHAKWNSWLISMTYETLFTMRGTTGGILQHHQILRLPRKMILQNFRNISPKQLKRHFQCGADPSWIRARSELDPTMIREWNRHSATRLATEVTFHAHHRHFVLKNTTFRAPAIIPNFTKYCACHEKWHFNFTEYCACHAKWLASLILITCHTSFTMRSETALTLRPH